WGVGREYVPAVTRAPASGRAGKPGKEMPGCDDACVRRHGPCPPRGTTISRRCTGAWRLGVEPSAPSWPLHTNFCKSLFTSCEMGNATASSAPTTLTVCIPIALSDTWSDVYKASAFRSISCQHPRRSDGIFEGIRVEVKR